MLLRLSSELSGPKGFGNPRGTGCANCSEVELSGVWGTSSARIESSTLSDAPKSVLNERSEGTNL